jgi:hypothetical protein
MSKRPSPKGKQPSRKWLPSGATLAETLVIPGAFTIRYFPLP